MAQEYSVEVCKKIEEIIHDADLYRPIGVDCYDPGDELVYEVTGVAGANKGSVRVAVEKFVGGGFAGQVYRVNVTEIHAENEPIGGLEVGGVYAMKIMIPSSGFSRVFRDVLYWIGFQGPFQLQANPTAARAGALWQKFIRRGAGIRFGDENTVNDIHATFVDSALGSCGEFSDWVDGRTWRLEVDDHLDYLKKWSKGKNVDESYTGSPEYRAKHKFMHRFVDLLHDMGGHEFARQYEWSTCKSQPNCLKRKDTEGDPSAGLVAVDFRAGLALLPFLPMSPGDFKLILNGLGRGSLVQFDRGSLKKLESFINAHGDDFRDMQGMLVELKESERIYRDSIPDITHNHVRLLYSKTLWSTILASAVTGWKVRNIVDEEKARKLEKNTLPTLLFFLIGLIPVLGSFVRKIIGRADMRKHYRGILTSQEYFRRAFRAKMAERVIGWHRAGRIDETKALDVVDSTWRFWGYLLLSFLPVGIFKLLTDWQYAKERIANIIIRPVRLYFDAELREQWLRDMVSEGKKKYILSNEDAGVILSQIKEPFIQKYLKSLAVHVCTLPVSQVVSVTVAIIYVLMHPEMPKTQSWAIGLGIIALFQVTPISPGSLVRGVYVLYLVIKERNFKDYNIAVFLGFFKYIGYLAFPIQMAYRYPVLARFMAAHWANESVHIVPVFGEAGALLEHWVYCLFYNWPLTIMRRIKKRIEKRAQEKPRYWHVGLCALAAAAIFGTADYIFLESAGKLPGLKDIWYLAIFIPLVCGALVTLGCGGAVMWKRLVGATLCGVSTSVLYTAITVIIGRENITTGDIVSNCLWRVFIFSIFTTIGAILMELKMGDPDSL